MDQIHGFELVREENIPQLKSIARLYRHVKTGAELMSVMNDDENKSFMITFRTPPVDSTGVAHILEHSVLCGSKKYPLKEPFIELVKGSLNTFLNAMTGNAETYYPVASVNEQDFYNLVDVYLDAVFFPNLTPYTLKQEGWHYELEDKNDPLIYKGVVFNEMKGSYQSPDTILYDYAERSLFPNHVYGVSSGGDPKVIPNLTFERLDGFHKYFYHPSNSRIWFWGDDNPERRLKVLDEYLSRFEMRWIESLVPLHEPFQEPVRESHTFAVGEEDPDPKSMMSVNWVMTDRIDVELDLSFDILSHILTGTPASPLRKALIDSGMVETVSAGISDIRQRTLLMGMKGLKQENADKIEALVFDTLKNLAENGIPKDAVEASFNTTEFGLRELNTGGFPRGLAMGFYAIKSWIYNEDPFKVLNFDSAIAAVREKINAGPYFETMIKQYLLDNPYRSVLVYTPDPGKATRETEEEKQRLDAVRAALSEADLEKLVSETQTLQTMQQTPDSEDALATLPRLTIADLDPKIKTVPTEIIKGDGYQILFHDLPTNGIVYLDLGFDEHVLPQDLLPFISLFGRSLLQLGTEKEDFVTLTQRIGRKTGGIRPEQLVSSIHGDKNASAHMFLRAKATTVQADDMLDILRDIITLPKLDNPERFKQMVLEDRVRLESSIASSGHGFVSRRLSSRFSEAGWLGEITGGLTYFNFIRDLCDKVTTDWPSVLAKLEQIRSLLLNNANLIVNVTLDKDSNKEFQPKLEKLLSDLPKITHPQTVWSTQAEHVAEAFVIPGQVNFVGKALNLAELGYQPHGSALVINNLLRTTWLWEKVRVEGGAYGGFCSYDHINRLFQFGSYRDPNLLETLDIYDATGNFLKDLHLSDSELVRNIIGTISDLDAYQLPDAKGYSAMVRHIIGETDERRQQRRDQVLGTTIRDMREFGELLCAIKDKGEVSIVGSADSVNKAGETKPDWLKVTKVL